MVVISEGGATTEWIDVSRWLVEVGFWDDDGMWADGSTWQDLPAWTVIHTGDRTDEV